LQADEKANAVVGCLRYELTIIAKPKVVCLKMIDELKSMSRKELEKLLIKVEKALTAARARDQRDARKAAQKAAAEFGFSLGDISEDAKPIAKKPKAKTKLAKKSAKPKYANPTDKTQTWTGKGRQPNWYRAEVETGTAPEDMAI